MYSQGFINGSICLSITSRAEESSDDEEYLISGGRGRGRGRSGGGRRGSMEGVRSVRSARGRGRSRSKSGRSQGPTGDVIALGDKNRRADVLQVKSCLTLTKLT